MSAEAGYAGIDVGPVSHPEHMRSGEVRLRDPDVYTILIGHWGDEEHEAWERQRPSEARDGQDPVTLVMRSGALSGATTAVAFAALHDLLISDISFSLVPMMIAGAACGLCLGWSYALPFDRACWRTWFTYNVLPA